MFQFFIQFISDLLIHSLIIIISSSGHAKIVELLANNGADVNKKMNGEHPILLAATKGSIILRRSTASTKN